MSYEQAQKAAEHQVKNILANAEENSKRYSEDGETNHNAYVAGRLEIHLIKALTSIERLKIK